MTRQRIGRCGWATISQQRGQQIAMRSTAVSVGGPNAPIPLVAPLDAHAYFIWCARSSCRVSFTCLMASLVIVAFLLPCCHPIHAQVVLSVSSIAFASGNRFVEGNGLHQIEMHRFLRLFAAQLPKMTKSTYAQTGIEYTPVRPTLLLEHNVAIGAVSLMSRCCLLFVTPRAWATQRRISCK